MKRHFVQLVVFVFSLFATAAFAAGEIRFQKASSIVSQRYGQSQQGINFEVNVANLAYQKQVYARLNQPNGGWVDVPLSYSRSLNNNREIWTGSYARPLNVVLDASFSLKYVVNGQTYTDTNGGQNYSLAADSGNRLAAGINVYPSNYAQSVTLAANSNIFSTGITVRDFGQNKTVRVHYTTDNWATKSIVPASFNHWAWRGHYSSAPNPNQYQSEEWFFEANVGYNSTVVEYALEYVSGSQTYWDNNTGLNYRTTLVRQ